jgi:hypothetical protein
VLLPPSPDRRRCSHPCSEPFTVAGVDLAAGGRRRATMAWRHRYQQPPGLLPGHIGPATFDAGGVATSGLASVTATGVASTATLWGLR